MNLTLPPSQGFSSGETAFHLLQFLSNFFRYSSSNFLLSYLYNIFTVNFSSSSPLLKSLSSAMSIFSCLLTSTFILPSNSFKASPAFFKFSFLSQVSPSDVSSFHQTKYFSTPLIFFLFRIFSTSHSFHFHGFSFLFLLPLYLLLISNYLAHIYYWMNSHRTW